MNGKTGLTLGSWQLASIIRKCSANQQYSIAINCYASMPTEPQFKQCNDVEGEIRQSIRN